MQNKSKKELELLELLPTACIINLGHNNWRVFKTNDLANSNRIAIGNSRKNVVSNAIDDLTKLNKFIMKRLQLTKQQIEFLEKKGFSRGETKHSGFWFIEQDEPLATYIFIPGYESDVNTKHAYKFEILESNFFEESVMDKQYISEDQSFEDFINFWID